MTKRDRLGDIAHIFTGAIGRECCYKTGGYNTDRHCECRDLAETLIENKAEVIALLSAVGEKRSR